MTDWREEWQDADKVYVVVTAGFILAAGFMGFQFMEYRNALEDEGCRYYYETHVDGVEDTSNGTFMNSTEYQRVQEAKQDRIEDYRNPPGPIS